MVDSMSKGNLLSIAVLLTDETISTHKTILSVVQAIEAASLSKTTSLSLVVQKSSKISSSYLRANKNFLEKHDVCIVNSSSFDIKESLDGAYSMILLPGDLVSRSYFSALHQKRLNTDTVLIPKTAVHYFGEPFHAPIIAPTPILSNDELALSSVVPPLYCNGIMFPTRWLTDQSIVSTGTIDYRVLSWSVTCCHLDTVAINEGAVYCRLYDKPSDYYASRDAPHFFSSESHSPLSLKRATIPASFNPFRRADRNSRKYRIRAALEPYPLALKAAIYSIRVLNQVRSFSSQFKSRKRHLLELPQDCINEILSIHTVEPRVFAYQNKLKGHGNFISAPNPEALFAPALYYRQSLDYLKHDVYDYVIIVPWLIAGGADKFFMNYANTIAKLRQNKRVLVISTEPARDSLSRDKLMLHKDIDFLPIAEIIKNIDSYSATCQTILAKLIAQVRPSVVHVASSLIGFMFIENQHQYLRSHGIKIVTTGYNEIVDEYGKRQGYVHECIPRSYPHTNIITTDNHSIVAMWSNEYGIDPKRTLVHKQPFAVPKLRNTTPAQNNRNGIRLLWASHIRKEKNVEMAIAIAKHYHNSNSSVAIDCYGLIDKGHYPVSPFAQAPDNITFRGSFSNIFKDVNLNEYDAFLYTSKFDGTPNILIEIGLAKLPIISSAIGGIPDLLKDDAYLIQHPDNKLAFISAIDSLVGDKSPFKSNAEALYVRLKEGHTYPAFEKDVDHMLKLLDY